MPKVLRIINRLNLGGPTYNASYLSRYMSSRYETMLIAGMKDDSEASSEFIPRSMGLKPVYIHEMRRSIHPFKDWEAYHKIKSIIEEFQPDIVHTHAAKAGALGRLAAYRCRVPVIIHTFHGHVFHSYFNPIKTRFYIEIERYLARKSQRIIAISTKQKKELVKVYKIAPDSKVDVIPLGFDLQRFNENREQKRQAFRTKYRVKEDEVAIGIVGRIVPVKNHSLFLEAMAKVSDHSNEKIRGFVIGDGEDFEIVKQKAQQMNLLNANGHGVPGTVTFTSWIKEIDEVMSGLDIVVLTSLNEGTPVSLIEAQAAGNPVVSSNVGGVEDVVLQKESGLLVDSNNVEQLARAIVQLAADPNLRKKYGMRGREFIHQKFNVERLVHDVENLYDQLLEKREIWVPTIS